MAQAAVNPKAVNLWTSRIIPAILIGIVGYVTWVVPVLVCVHYLLKPPQLGRPPRHGAAIAALFFYFALLLLMALCYFRLLFTVATNPGYVPRGPQWYTQEQDRTKARKRRSLIGNVDNQVGERSTPTTSESAPGLQDYFNRDVFICRGDGRPIWCSTCFNWKPDRAHHCREVDRCVRKMDHYCPWVGGVVSETSFKFFIQFLGWAFIYCLFNLILMAILVAEKHKEKHIVDVNWIVALAMAGLFGLFTLGMFGSSLQFALVNTTTIENLSRKSIVWQIAIHMPKLPAQLPKFRTISYSTAQADFESQTQGIDATSTAVKTYAILHGKPGDNPWDLGPLANFKTVMGEHWYDWLIPVKYSPCCNHDRDDSQFALGPVVDRIRRDAGLDSPADVRGKHGRRRRRRSRRHPNRRTTESNGIMMETQGQSTRA